MRVWKTEKPAKLPGRECMRPVGFERQAFERCSRQVLPLGFESLRDIFGQFQRDLHDDAYQFIISGYGTFSQFTSTLGLKAGLCSSRCWYLPDSRLYGLPLFDPNRFRVLETFASSGSFVGVVGSSPGPACRARR